jgi:hypothetical protein
MNRNQKKYEDASETPEEIVGLIGNFANRPDIRSVQERQVREIKTLILSHIDRISKAIDTNLKRSVEYLDNGDCHDCDPEVNWHSAECTLHQELSNITFIIEDIKKQYK